MENKWFEIKNTTKQGKARINTKIWVKGKSGLKWYKQQVKMRKEMTSLLKPSICYTSDYDIFSICWLKKKLPIYNTVELNLLGEGDLRLDFIKTGEVVGIEIEDFKEVLKHFNCDKREPKRRIK